MSLAIHKQTIHEFKDFIPGFIEFTLELPQVIKYLDVQVNGGLPRLWILVDQHTPKTIHKFHVYGTGFDIPVKEAERLEYIATYQHFNEQYKQDLVHHLFEVKNT